MKTLFLGVLTALPLTITPIDTPHTRFRTKCSESAPAWKPREPFRSPNEQITPREGEINHHNTHQPREKFSNSPLKTAPDESKIVEQKFQEEGTNTYVKKIHPQRNIHTNFSRNPMDAPVEDPVFVSLFPHTPREFKTVFRTSQVTQRDLNELKSLSQSFENLPGNKIKPTQESPEVDIYSTIETHKNSPIIFFGHSKHNGEHLILSNGEAIKVSIIHKRCVQSGAKCLVLTCNGKDFSVSGKLLAKHAHNMWQDAFIKSVHREILGKSMTVGEFRSEMIASRKRAILKHKIIVSATISLPSGYYIVYSENTTQRKRSIKPSSRQSPT